MRVHESLYICGHTVRETHSHIHTHVVMPSLADPSLFHSMLGVREGHQLAGFDGAGSKLSLLYVSGAQILRSKYYPLDVYHKVIIHFYILALRYEIAPPSAF